MHYKAGEQIVLTYEDYSAMPDDGKKREIIDGILHMSPSPNRRHQRAIGRLYRLLDDYVDSRKLGEVFLAPFDVLFSKTDVVQPDVLFVGLDRMDIVTEGNIQGSPDLVVEILSSDNRDYDRKEKLQLYATCSVQHYWIIDPDERRVTELTDPKDRAYHTVREFDAGQTFTPRLFPDLTVNVADLLSL